MWKMYRRMHLDCTLLLYRNVKITQRFMLGVGSGCLAISKVVGIL